MNSDLFGVFFFTNSKEDCIAIEKTKQLACKAMLKEADDFIKKHHNSVPKISSLTECEIFYMELLSSSREWIGTFTVKKVKNYN